MGNRDPSLFRAFSLRCFKAVLQNSIHSFYLPRLIFKSGSGGKLPGTFLGFDGSGMDGAKRLFESKWPKRQHSAG